MSYTTLLVHNRQPGMVFIPNRKLYQKVIDVHQKVVAAKLPITDSLALCSYPTDCSTRRLFMFTRRLFELNYFSGP